MKNPNDGAAYGGMSDEEFIKLNPGSPSNWQWKNDRLMNAALYKSSSRARDDIGWDRFFQNNQANALATQMRPAEQAPQQVPQIAQAPLSSYQNGASSGGMGMGPTRRGGFMQGEDDFYSRRLRDLISKPGSFTGTPGFKFALDNGRQAIERSFAAKGMGNSGNVLSELMKYGTGLASQEYGNRVNELAGLAGKEPPTWAMRGRY